MKLTNEQKKAIKEACEKYKIPEVWFEEQEKRIQEILEKHGLKPKVKPFNKDELFQK